MSLLGRDPISQHHASRLSEEGKLSRSRKLRPRSTVSYAIGAVALGAVALGALAVGAVAIGKLAIGRARIRRLEIDELVVRHLRVTEDLQAPQKPGADS
jgi:hypothetical protein